MWRVVCCVALVQREHNVNEVYCMYYFHYWQRCSVKPSIFLRLLGCHPCIMCAAKTPGIERRLRGMKYYLPPRRSLALPSEVHRFPSWAWLLTSFLFTVYTRRLGSNKNLCPCPRSTRGFHVFEICRGVVVCGPLKMLRSTEY